MIDILKNKRSPLLPTKILLKTHPHKTIIEADSVSSNEANYPS